MTKKRQPYNTYPNHSRLKFLLSFARFVIVPPGVYYSQSSP